MATQWLTRTGADLAFNWLEDGRAADIRISFELNGSWSLLGRDVLTSAKPGEATMNYGWLKPGSTDVEVREVVLHEFGHALGFIHEHQNPVGGIEWNREEVIKSLSGPPNSWSVEEIERNVLAPYEPRSLIGTPFDPASIMLYPFPPEWTLNGFSSRNNTELSDRDIELARRIYT